MGVVYGKYWGGRLIWDPGWGSVVLGAEGVG